MTWRRRSSRFAGFAVLPMFGAVTPLLALPAITQTHGVDGWTAIAVGQSVGAGGAVLVELGWGLTGPQAVAGAGPDEQRRLFSQAAASKSAALAVVGPVVLVIAALLATHHTATAVLSALAITSSGLSPSWFFIGQGRPRAIFLTDTVPRLGLTLAGVVCLYAGLPLWTFAVCSVLGYVLSFGLGARLVGPELLWRPELRVVAVLATVRSQRMAVAGRGLSALYIGLPTSLVQAASPASVAAFSAAERLLRMGLLILQSVPNSFQRYLGSPATAAERSRRVLVTVAAQVVIGIVAACVVIAALPLAVDVLLTGTVAVPTSLAVLGGGVAFATCASRGTGLALVSSGDVRWVTFSAAAGAMLGLTCIPLLATTSGATGAMTGLLVAEAGVLMVQSTRLVRSRTYRAPRTSSPAGAEHG